MTNQRLSEDYPIKNLEELNEAAHAFFLEYALAGPFSGHIIGSGYMSKVAVVWLESGKVKSPEQVAEDLREKNEDPEEMYLLVCLRYNLPEGMELPATYKGFKLFTRVMVEAEAQAEAYLIG